MALSHAFSNGTTFRPGGTCPAETFRGDHSGDSCSRCSASCNSRAPPRDARSCWKRITEFDATEACHQREAFIIGSIRNPCDHLVSLWGFASSNAGSAMYHQLVKQNMRHFLCKHPPTFDDSRDVAAFRVFVRGHATSERAMQNGVLIDRLPS